MEYRARRVWATRSTTAAVLAATIISGYSHFFVVHFTISQSFQAAFRTRYCAFFYIARVGKSQLAHVIALAAVFDDDVEAIETALPTRVVPFCNSSILGYLREIMRVNLISLIADQTATLIARERAIECLICAIMCFQLQNSIGLACGGTTPRAKG